MVATWNTENNGKTIDDIDVGVGDHITLDGNDWRISQVRAWNETLIVRRNGETQVIGWDEI